MNAALARPEVQHATREQWLAALVEMLRPHFTKAGYTIPAKVRVSCGWPSVGATRKKNPRIGEAWSHRASADKVPEIFISPAVGEPVRAGDILVHELVHVTVGPEHGHKGPFRKAALAVGLKGKMTATVAGDELARVLKFMCAELGPYPHAPLLPSGDERKKQTTRMLKVACGDCGYTVRTTAKWLEHGTPTCPCGSDMEAV